MDEDVFEIQQWSEPLKPLTIQVFPLHIDPQRIFQANRHRAGGIPLAAEVEDHLRNQTRTMPLEHVEVLLQNYGLPHRCRGFGMKKDRC